MKTTSLNGKWKLYYLPEEEKSIVGLERLKSAGVKCVDAVVPGNVELDLMRSGELPDLFYGSNIYQLRPYETYEWWYEKEFSAPDNPDGRKVELVFHGVDCLATYWLNGELIGQSDNMFIEHRFDITDKLKSGSNELIVRLGSSVVHAMKQEYSPSMWALNTNWEQVWTRKAAHSYGWDIMPRALSAGLWRSVELVICDEHEITDLYFHTTSVEEDMAVVGGYFQLKTQLKYMDDLYMRIRGQCGDSTFDVTEKVLFKVGTFEIKVRRPKLWWPRGYGEANVYDVTVELLHKDKVVASRHETIGIRIIELVRTNVTSSDERGEFLFKVNDVPIMCKGSNWVPADAFHSRDAERYDRLLELFADVKCNMIRCWGGSVYEDHAFYDFCDRNGIMVWQDFSMACACYPQEESFFEKMRLEATSVIKKLRNHPSIALWCGDNECDVFYSVNGLKPSHNKVTREVLPAAVFECDPYRPFLPSSPYISPELESEEDFYTMPLPEQHLWGPRDYYKSRFYTEHIAHFVGEIGYHGCPNLSSIKRFIDEDHLWPWQDNEQWITHCSDPLGKGGPYSYRIKLMADQIREMFGIYPDNIEDFIVASQISQAEAKKFFIEMTRLKKWDRTGILWWNMVDGWPQFSDAVVDYYLGKKLAYEYIKRVQQEICIMVDEPHNWHVKVAVGNDSNCDAKGSYRIWDADSDETLLEGEFFIKANENKDLGRIRVSQGKQQLFLMEWTVDGKRYGNHYLVGSPPFSFPKYKEWIKKIATLEPGFCAEKVGK